MTDRTAHLILGLPRSGTSAVAQLLSDAGVHFGDPAHFLDTTVHKHNPNFFEMEWVNDANNRAVEILGSRYSDDFLPVEADFDDPALHDLKLRIGERLRAEFGDVPRIGIKDPRFCLTLPLWRPLLEAIGYGVSAVVTLRSAAACRRSNLALEGKWADDRTWSRFYLQSLLGARYFTRELQTTVVDYDALMADPVAYAAGLRLGGVDLAAATAKLDPALVHQRPADDGDGLPTRVQRAVRDGTLPATAYLDYRTVAALQTAELAPAGVRSCRVELAAAHELIAELTRQRDAQRLHAQQLTAEVAAKQDAAEHHQQSSAEWERQRNAVQLHADQLAGAVAAKQAAADHHERHAAELDRQLDAARRHAGQLSAEVAAKQAAVDHHAPLAAELERQRDGFRLHAEQLAEVVSVKQAALDHHERRARDLERERDELRGHVDRLATAVTATQASVDHFVGLLSATTADAVARGAAAAAEADQLRAQRAVLADRARVASRRWPFGRAAAAVTEADLRPVTPARLVVGCPSPMVGRVRVELAGVASSAGVARLYCDGGGPFDPARVVDLGPVDGESAVSAEVVLAEPAVGFWLDPVDPPATFAISRFRLFCVGR